MPGHWAYMASGVDDDATLRANREGFKHVELRPRRLRDATKVDMRVELFGTAVQQPDLPVPDGRRKILSPRGRIGRGAGGQSARHSAVPVHDAPRLAVEDVNKALGRPVWQQLYAPSSWDACEKILRRVEAAGCSVIALTVDNTTGRNSETYLRTRPKDLQPSAAPAT